MELRRGPLVVALALVVSSCGAEQAGDAPAASSTASAPPTSASVKRGAPATGTVLQHLEGRGRENLISGGDGFTFVDSVIGAAGKNPEDQSAITTYDAAGVQLARLATGTFSGECGAADVVVAGRRTVLTELITRKAAQGITPATSALDLDAWDARDGTHLWRARVVPDQAAPLSCASYNGVLASFAATRDGKSGLYRTPDGAGAVVDLVSGATRTVPLATNVLGNYFAHVDPATPTGRTDIIEPAGGTVVGASAAGGVRFGRGLTLATTPLFEGGGAGGSPTVGLTGDGTKVAASMASQLSAIVVYSLPDMKQQWTVPAAGAGLVGAAAGLVFLRQQGAKANEAKLTAYSDATGERKWEVPYGEVCGITSTQLLLFVNDQLATIDLASGAQVSYRDAPKGAAGQKDCPVMLVGGLSVRYPAGGVDVVQEIRP